MKITDKKQIFKKRIFYTLSYFIPVAFLTTISMGLFIAAEHRNFDLMHDEFSDSIVEHVDENKELMEIFEGQQWEGLSMSEIDEILIENGREPMFFDLKSHPIYSISTKQISDRLLKRINFTGRKVLKEDRFIKAREKIFESSINYVLILWLFLLFIFAVLAYWISGRVIKPLVESLEKQSQFISDAAHELKTPLSLIKTDADVLNKMKETNLSDYESFRQRTVKSINYLNNLTSKLLKLSRLESGKKDLVEKINISETVLGIFDYFENKALEKEIDFQKKVKKNIYSKISEQDITQLVTILLDNAIKYTPKKGKVKLTLENDKKSFYIKVSDSGKGIEKKEREKVFERFYRVDKSRSESSHGLGLAIAKQISSENRGKIEIEKSKFGGAMFIIKLPIIKK